METSTGGDGVGVGVDCAVGTIVWVRRRNGSWWPGRILGSDELSASHLMSPRSGTPVKLLGREDASVDWYNLEKSKRVKAFRCGEFDACIERAEASQGAPIKKREKYARREDAILHALEIEKKQFEAQQQELGPNTSSKTSGSHKSEPTNFNCPEPYLRHNEQGTCRNLSSPTSHNIITKADFSQDEENLIDSYVTKKRASKQFRWQDDSSEVMPRMRGLQDFGLRTFQSKRKPSQIVNWQNFTKPLDNHVEMLSGSGCLLEDAVHASSSKNSMTVKRKRSQGRMADEFFIKKRDRRRPLVQVLESSAKLAPHLLQCKYSAVGNSMQGEKEHMLAIRRAKRSKCVYFPHNTGDHANCDEHDSQHLSVLENQLGAGQCLDSPVDVVKEYGSSGLIEANASDSLEADYLDHDMGEVANMLTDTAHVLVPGSKDCEPPEFQVPDEFRRLNDEIPNSGTISHLHENITDLHEHFTDASAEVGVSKWHMKGKRNTRSIGKRLAYAVDGKIYSSENCNGSMNIEGAELSNQRPLRWGVHSNKESFYTCEEGDLIDNDLVHSQLNVYPDWRNSLPSLSKDDGRGSHIAHNDSDNNSHGQAPSMAHSAVWEEPTEQFDPIYELEPLLVDIDIKVEASYQGEHVPLVSLMSRLNGKAIVGHPIQIELLESGSTVHLVSNFDLITDETSAPPPVWRTARRTAMQRVPRLNPPSAAAEDEDPDLVRHSGHTSLLKKPGSHSCPSRSRKLQKKSSKRLSLSSQKTRTLSSLATNYKLDGGSGGVELATSSDILEGLIKPEGSAPLVACVPVKVVFSRLLEAVGKPSSAAAHRVRVNSPAIRDPS